MPLSMKLERPYFASFVPSISIYKVSFNPYQVKLLNISCLRSYRAARFKRSNPLPAFSHTPMRLNMV